ELRASLDTTQYDLSTPQARGPAGHAADRPRRSAPAAPASAPHPGTSAVPEAEDPSVPLRTLGEYRILRRLGEGGMGSVYLAYQEGAARQVALKVLPDHLAFNQPSLDRFYREA